MDFSFFIELSVAFLLKNIHYFFKILFSPFFINLTKPINLLIHWRLGDFESDICYSEEKTDFQILNSVL